jgi:DNA-binding NtrC family response regulator
LAKQRILVLEDDPSIRCAIHDYLENRGYEVLEASTCREADKLFHAVQPDAAILDFTLPDGNSLDLVPALKRLTPSVPILILTAHSSIDLAVRAIQEGADQFLAKPVELAALAAVLERLLENQRNRQKQMASRSRQSREAVNPFLGRSAAIRRLAEQAERVLPTESPIWIQGETGSGKGVLARWLHEHGPRAEEAFVDLNCAGLMRELVESELFGYERGAFTGAVAPKAGLLEVAHRGTVFLDEIADVDLQVQPKLLKVLEEKQFRRLGDVRDRRVDIRLIAASHQPLAQMVAEKKFRSDLYFRISTIPLTVPPLRERSEDIPLLADLLLERLGADMGRGAVELTPEAVETLQRHHWPGNIREMRNVLERAILLSGKRILEPRDLQFDQQVAPGPGWDTGLTIEEMEQTYIRRVLEEEGGRVERAARRLGIPRSSLYHKLKRYQIQAGRA